MLLVFKLRFTGEPEHLAQTFKYENRLGHLIVPNTDLEIARKSFSVRAANQWNQLAFSLRSTKKIGDFKKGLKLWIEKNVPRFPD